MPFQLVNDSSTEAMAGSQTSATTTSVGMPTIRNEDDPVRAGQRRRRRRCRRHPPPARVARSWRRTTVR